MVQGYKGKVLGFRFSLIPPIHLFTPQIRIKSIRYQSCQQTQCIGVNVLEIKCKSGQLRLVGVKTTIHLFTYSPFSATPSIPLFRRTEPKRDRNPKIRQNWAHATNFTNHHLGLLIHHHLEIKCKSGQLRLVGVKTTIHLFTYSLPPITPPFQELVFERQEKQYLTVFSSYIFIRF